MKKRYNYKRTLHNGKHTGEHRAIMEEYLGRKLTNKEVVHHINGDPRDNRIENLVVLTYSEHSEIHLRKHPIYKICPNCGKKFKPPIKHRGRNRFCCFECSCQYHAKEKMMPVIKTDKKTGEETWYGSMTTAAREMGVDAPNIWKALHGKIKSAYGYYWRFEQ